MWVNVVNEWQAFQIYPLMIKRLMDGFNVTLNYYLLLLINPESSKQNWRCCKCSSAAKSEVAPVVSHGHILSAPHSHMQKCVYQSSTRAELLVAKFRKEKKIAKVLPSLNYKFTVNWSRFTVARTSFSIHGAILFDLPDDL